MLQLYCHQNIKDTCIRCSLIWCKRIFRFIKSYLVLHQFNINIDRHTRRRERGDLQEFYPIDRPVGDFSSLLILFPQLREALCVSTSLHIHLIPTKNHATITDSQQKYHINSRNFKYSFCGNTLRTYRGLPGITGTRSAD